MLYWMLSAHHLAACFQAQDGTIKRIAKSDGCGEITSKISHGHNVGGCREAARVTFTMPFVNPMFEATSKNIKGAMPMSLTVTLVGEFCSGLSGLS